ncbi:MAG: hypothetical protein O3A13_15260 [Proteobacteria bacterium]|nr:hypothetical protein [Pseudomonadota bacterium]MDA0994975.1 hypothetical protein [Pseudomonadota bacterium]
MQETDTWLADYGEDHRDINYGAIYWISVMTIIFGTVGILWSLPVPEAFSEISPILNWGSTFLMAAVVYYFIISMALAIGMLPFVFGVATTQIWLEHSSLNHSYVAALLAVASLVGIYMGRSGNGAARAVLRDIQMMMIAPVWLLSNVYRRLGIPF